MRYLSFVFRVWIYLCAAAPVFANIPGGGNGAGANVTLVNNGNGTVTLANGIVTAQIKISTAQILQLTYNGFHVTDGGTVAMESLPARSQ